MALMLPWSPYCSVVGSDGNIVCEAYIEDGKLFYDNRWYVYLSIPRPTKYHHRPLLQVSQGTNDIHRVQRTRPRKVSTFYPEHHLMSHDLPTVELSHHSGPTR